MAVFCSSNDRPVARPPIVEMQLEETVIEFTAKRAKFADDRDRSFTRSWIERVDREACARTTTQLHQYRLHFDDVLIEFIDTSVQVISSDVDTLGLGHEQLL